MARSNRVYSVTVGLYGYLPNSCYYTRTLGQARLVAQEEKRAFLDYAWDSDNDEQLRVSGNIRKDGEYDITRVCWNGDRVSWQYIRIEDITNYLDDDELAELVALDELEQMAA